MLGNYELLVDAIPLSEINKIVSFTMEDEQKQRLIAYVIAKRLEGVTMDMPQRTHKTDFANLLISFGVDKESVIRVAEISRATYYRLRKNNE